jgi:hypothetical protein
MTTPPTELQQFANPKRAHLMGAGLLGMSNDLGATKCSTPYASGVA